MFWLSKFWQVFSFDALRVNSKFFSEHIFNVYLYLLLHVLRMVIGYLVDLSEYIFLGLFESNFFVVTNIIQEKDHC